MVTYGWKHIGRIAVLTVLYCGLSSGIVRADGETVVMYKDPNCGCCGKWAEHMRSSGFTVQEIVASDMDRIKRAAGVPPTLGSCHTASVGGYAIEGHVPAQDVKRLLHERPALDGIAVAGMPAGSPGMEGPYEAQRYEVIGFSRDGATRVFSQH